MKHFKTKYTLLVTALLASVGLSLPLIFGYAQTAHGSDDHSHAKGDSLQTKAHGDEDDHGHDHEHHEDRTQIDPESAKRMGIVVEKAGAAQIEQSIPLAGYIVLEKNTRIKVPARFPGIVRSVMADLGQYVEEGQVLAIVEANESLREYEVLAPISGYVLERNTNRGDVAGGDPLFVIADLSKVWAKFHVFPRDVDAVRSGQSVQVQAFYGNPSQQSQIDRLLPLADAASQTQIAISVLPNEEGRWKPGMAIVGNVAIAQKTVPVAVKKSALQKMEELGDVVFVQEGDVYEVRPVKLGVHGKDYVQILEGLSVGERYVAESSFIIKSDILKSTATHSH